MSYCPHGYDECWQGCVYPGRCGRFRTHPARYWLDRAILQVETRPMSIVAYARAWYWITRAQIAIGDVRIDPNAPLLD